MSILISGAANAVTQVSEIILNDGTGKMLNQVSGLARLNQWVVVLVQDRDELFYVSDNELSMAYASNKSSINLESIKLTGTSVPASWEAIEFTKQDNKIIVYLSHEHDFKGDSHHLYQADVFASSTSFKIAPLTKVAVELPLLSNESVPLKRRYNYGYEAMVWEEASNVLYLLPELKSQQKLTLNVNTMVKHASVAKHPLRASDLVYIGNQCAIATSNCFESESFTDALCETGNGEPKLSLATFQLTNTSFEYVDSIDVSKNLMKVAFAPRLNNNELGQLYNMEGITTFQNGYLVVNDNIPVNKARTALRYIKLDNLNLEQCSFK